MPVSPEWIVNPPQTAPVAHSLLMSAEVVVESPDSRWEGGFVFKPENCIEAEVWQPCGPDGEIRIFVQVDATGGSWILQYEGGGDQVLPYNATAAEVNLALDAASDGLSAGYMTAHDGTAATDSGAQLFIIITQPNPLSVPLFNPNGFNFIDNPDDPLTGGGATINFTILGIGDYQGYGADPSPWPSAEVKKDYDGYQSNITYHPFVVEVPYTCSTWGFKENDYEGRAHRQLHAGLTKALEREFWTGEKNPSNINLTYWTPNDDVHVLNPGGAAAPTPVTPVVALTLLEAALAGCATGSQGMLHVTQRVADLWATLYFIDDDGPDRILRTRSREDVVVVGAGYPGTGPFGQPDPDPGTQWAFATGMVDIRLGEPMIYPDEFWQALDRSTNTVTFRGEQTAAVVHDGCCSFAVLVDVSGGA